MNKTEIFIQLILEIMNTPRNMVATSEFIAKHEINYKTWRRYIKEMREKYIVDGLPVLQEHAEESETYITLNKSMFKYHYPTHLETAFYLEAYAKIGHFLDHKNLKKDIEEIKSEVFELNGRGEQLTRKFHYLSKTDGQATKNDNQSILVQALIENKKVTAVYNEKDYTLFPLCLTMYRGSLYLVAYKDAMLVENLRHFKLVRFNHIEITSDFFSYPNLSEWNPEEYFKNNSGIIGGEKKTCSIRVFAESMLQIKEKNFFDGKLLSESEEFLDLELSYTSRDEFLGQLFVYAQDIEILTGEEIKKAFAKKARLALARNKAA